MFKGPLPPAFAAISLRAFSSAQIVSLLAQEMLRVWYSRTGSLLFEVGQVVFVEVLVSLLGLLQGLDLAACIESQKLVADRIIKVWRGIFVAMAIAPSLFWPPIFLCWLSCGGVGNWLRSGDYWW